MARYKSSQFPLPGRSYDTAKATDPRDLEPDWDGTRDERTQREIDAQQFAADVNTLAAIFRTELADTPHTAQGFARALNVISHDVCCDASFQPNALFLQQVYSDWGPAGVLLALQRAYTEKQRVSDVVEHP